MSSHVLQECDCIRPLGIVSQSLLSEPGVLELETLAASAANVVRFDIEGFPFHIGR